jgi:CRP-like cAMP-binding protein
MLARGAALDAKDKNSNRLLIALEPNDLAALEPELEDVKLSLAATIYEDGGPLEYVYFPRDCVISLVAILREGTSPEMTTFGREGAVGTISLLGAKEAFGRYTVQVAGTALRVPVKRFRALTMERPNMRDLFFRYLQALIAQTLQTVACNAAHPVEARCCRWILMTHDRVGRDEIPLTHEFLSVMLAVQRPTVSVVTRTLQTAGLITQRRGVITVVDRAGLEDAACECYGVIRRLFTRSLPKTYLG